MQLTNTPPLQSTAPDIHPVSIHQTSPLVRGSKHPITAYYSIYRPQKDERLSRPAWLVTYRNKMLPPGVEPGHVTHPSTNRARRRVTSLIRPTLLPLRHAATQLLPGPFLLSYSIFVFRYFFVSVPCARLSWPSRQLVGAHKYTVSYCIVMLFQSSGQVTDYTWLPVMQLMWLFKRCWCPKQCEWAWTCKEINLAQIC